MFACPNTITAGAYATSLRLQALPRAVTNALQQPQLFRAAADLQQPRFVSLQLDLRPHACNAIRVSSHDGATEERRPLHLTHLSPYRLTVATDDGVTTSQTIGSFELSFILQPEQVRGHCRQTRLTIAAHYIPEPWWPPTIPQELVASTELWFHRLEQHLSTRQSAVQVELLPTAKATMSLPPFPTSQ